MALEPKELSELPTQNTLADDDRVTGLDESAVTPAAKNVNFKLSKIAEFVLGKVAIATKAEAEAGAATDPRQWPPSRIKEAILALSPVGTQHKLDATRAPLGTDDGTQGYSPTSLWVWPAQSRVWICRANATNIAVWIELTGAANPAPATEGEAAAGTATELRSWSPALVKAAVEALAPGGGGDANPATATEGEAMAGTVTELRSWSPALIKAAIEALAPEGGGGPGGGDANPATATEEEASAGTVTGLRSWSPALIKLAIEALAEGEANPASATGGEAAAGTVTELRSWSPALIKAAVEALAPSAAAATPYERLCKPFGETLSPYEEFDFFLAPVAGTIVGIEVESYLPGYSYPKFQATVNGSGVGPTVEPYIGSGSRKVYRTSLSAPVAQGSPVGVRVVEDGSGYGMAAQGLRAIIWFQPT